MAERSADVVIVGAGISGLACAHFLSERGYDVLVVEKDSRPGGVIETRSSDGFLYEIGPNSTLDSKPGLDRLVDELGLRGRLRPASPVASNRYILRGGSLHPLPMAPPSLIKSKLFSLRGKMRIAGEFFVGRRGDDHDESVADFVRRRFGHEFLEYAIGPFVSGVYAGDPERLSLRSAFPPMYEFESGYGGVIKGAMKTAKARRARNAARGKTGPSQLVTFDQGMAVLTECLAERLGQRLLLGTGASGLEALAGSRWRVRLDGAAGEETVTARAVVVSTPAEVAAGLVAPLNAEAAALFRDIPYAPVASVFTGFQRSDVAHPLDGFGFLVPAIENRDILGTIFSSSLFAGRAPDGSVSLTTFVGGMRRPELASRGEDELLDLVMRELADIIGVGGAPSFSHVFKWQRAIPQYALGHRHVTDAMDSLETEYSGLFFCTNYRRGVSVGDCVDQAASLSARITGAAAPDSL
jgi:oxygen-dependent protoporphyrinogen oxidase